MPEAYLEPSRISMVGLFAKITAKSYIIDVLLVFKWLKFFAKKSSLVVFRLVPEYASEKLPAKSMLFKQWYEENTEKQLCLTWPK